VKKILPAYTALGYVCWGLISLLFTPDFVAAQSLEDGIQEPTGGALREEEFTEIAPTVAVPAGDTTTTLEQIRAQRLVPIVGADRASTSLAQVTSVTQFSDVQPGDWAYEALAFLANSQEQGGLDCLEGYPDGSYRGNQAMTRFEFAAGLAACLDAIGTNAIDSEQLIRIEALQREFASELAVLRSRVDVLEARVDELEANQFSTTTTLSGQVIMGLVGATGAYPGADEDEATPAILSNTDGEPGSDAQFSLNYRVRLNLLTSFSGSDLLITGL